MTLHGLPSVRSVGYSQGMTIQPEELPLHLSQIDTSKGKWLIAVFSGAEAQTGDTILLKLILEQTIDKGEHFRARELGMIVLAPELHDPDLFAMLLTGFAIGSKQQRETAFWT